MTIRAGTVPPRIPVSDIEAYAWGYMVGYLGELPKLMETTFPDWDDPSGVPESLTAWLTTSQVESWCNGRDDGTSMYCDHAHPEDREA